MSKKYSNSVICEYGTKENYINVTSIIYEKFIFLTETQHILNIPIHTSYNHAFGGDPCLGTPKHLKITPICNSIIMRTQSLYIKEDTPIFIDLDKMNNGIDRYLVCVYFINCLLNDKYLELLFTQLDDLQNVGLMSIFSEIHIEAIIQDEHDIRDFKSNVKKRYRQEYDEGLIVINIHKENTHEYFGINKVWNIAKQKQNSLILYFHSKGITRLGNANNLFVRDRIEKEIFDITIRNYRYILFWLTCLPDIVKCGHSPNEGGFIWHNFWWVKSEYLRNIEQPIVSENRYYYEEWLRHRIDDIQEDHLNCMSATSNLNVGKYNIGSYYNPNTNKYY